MAMPRQALRHAVVSVPRRDRLASILVMLLIGTRLPDTPAFGDNWKERMEYWKREAMEAQASMNRCGLEFSPSDKQYLAQVNKCLKDRQPRFAEALRCMSPLEERCGYVREPPKAPDLATAAGQKAFDTWLEAKKELEKIVKRMAINGVEDANDRASLLTIVSGILTVAAFVAGGPALGEVAAIVMTVGGIYWYDGNQLQKIANDPPRDDIDIVSHFKSPAFALPAPADDLEARWQAFNVKVVSTAVCLGDLVTSQERVDGALMVKDRHGGRPVPQLPVQMAAVQHNATACAKLLRELSMLKQPTNEAWHTLMDILRRHQIDPTTLSPQEIRAHLRTLWEKQKPQLHTQWGLSQADIAELTQAMETGIERMPDRIPRLPDVLLDDKWVKNLESLAQALEQLALAYATGMPSEQPAQHSPPVPQR